MKKVSLLSFLLIIGLISCKNPQATCEKDKEKALSKIGADIYYIEHYPMNAEDSIALNQAKRDYEILFLKDCSKAK